MKEGRHTDPVVLGAKIHCMFVKQSPASGMACDRVPCSDLRHDALDAVTARALKRTFFITELFKLSLGIPQTRSGDCGSFGSSGILSFTIAMCRPMQGDGGCKKRKQAE